MPTRLYIYQTLVKDLFQIANQVLFVSTLLAYSLSTFLGYSEII